MTFEVTLVEASRSDSTHDPYDPGAVAFHACSRVISICIMIADVAI